MKSFFADIKLSTLQPVQLISNKFMTIFILDMFLNLGSSFRVFQVLLIQ